MVAPVSGPFIENISGTYSDQTIQRMRQRPPFDLPLYYSNVRLFGVRQTTRFSYGEPLFEQTIKEPNWNARWVGDFYRYQADAINQAYERLRSEVKSQAGWAENFAQINKTRSLITNRSVQLATFIGALRRGQFKKAARVLQTPVPSGAKWHKKLAGNFLEFEYGIKPIIQDIQESTKILLSDPGERRVSSSSSFNLGEGTSQTWSQYGGTVNTSEQITRSCSYNRKSGCYVRVTNANVALANQLGLIDLALPWKLVPFSFIVDWFINVEQVISSVTDWYGFSLTKPYSVEKISGSYKRVYHQTQVLSNDPTIMTYKLDSTETKNSYEFTRGTSIPGPTLTVRPFKGFSLSRASQALALVVAVLVPNRG